MALIELVINNAKADLGGDVRIQLDRIVSELRDPLKKTGTVSLPVTLPYTANNKAIFFGEDDHQLLGKFRKRYEAQLVVNNVVVVDGIWQQVKNTGKGFVGAIGEAKVSNPKIGDLLLNKKLTDIKSFTKLDYDGSTTIADSWQNTVAFPDAEVCFPFVATSFSDLQYGFRANYEDLGVSHFAAAILKNIFVDAGYTVDGEIFGNETFQKLVVLYSSSAKQAWNYGKLAPFRSECAVGFLGGYYEGGVSKVIERQTDNVHVFSYPFVPTDGDYAACMGNDGVYTCKFSGLYTLQVRGDVAGGSGSATPTQAFTAFRCITDNETIPDSLLPNTGGFNTLTDPLYLDNGTIAVGNGAGGQDLNFVARLEEGKQYAVQRYISIPKSASGGTFYYNPNSGKFHCSLVEAPMLLDPAVFLPDMSQSEFVNAMFKLFNLYYELNAEQQSLTLLTRNAFFKETLKDVIDLTPHLNVTDMDEYPLSDKEIAKTYLTYLTDESDHILKNTDYLALVNGDAPEESTKLPFAPLGFLRLTHSALDAAGTGAETGEDDFPAILPAQQSEDSSVLADLDNATVGGSWTPRLCLYQGNDWIKTTLPLPLFSLTAQYYNVRLGKEYRGIGNIFVGSGIVPISYDYTGPAPKLTFFDVNHQPAYRVTVNTALRSFALAPATTPTIYAGAGNAYFLTDVTHTAALERTSLATNVDGAVNPKGFFYKLYANDLLIGQLSNYFEGPGRMNADLFTRLTGRQTLRLGNDLFLLESIKNYDVEKSLCTYKLYKFVSNNATEDISAQRYTSTQSFTATCPTGETGTPTTATATRISFISQAAADAAALAAATTQATAILVCVVPTVTYTSTQTVTVECGQGYSGAPSTATATATSTVSQAYADTLATNTATSDANAGLSCTQDPDPGQ